MRHNDAVQMAEMQRDGDATPDTTTDPHTPQCPLELRVNDGAGAASLNNDTEEAATTESVKSDIITDSALSDEIRVNGGNCEVTLNSVVELAETTESVKTDINHVEQLLCDNHSAAVAQHNEVMLAVRSLTDKMNIITDRLTVMESNIIVMDTRLTNNESEIHRAKADIKSISDTVNRLENSQKQNVESAGKIVRQIEQRLDNLNVPIVIGGDTEADSVSNEVIDDNSILISNLPQSNNYESDVNALIWTGLCLNINTKTVKKLDSRGDATKLKIEFYTLADKMTVLKAKRQLRNTNEYYDIFIEGFKSRTEMMMERNFKTLIQTIPRGHMFNMSTGGRLVRNTRTHNNRY